MPGYLVPAQQSTNPFTPTNLVSSSTVGDAIVELSQKTVNDFKGLVIIKEFLISSVSFSS
jgi:hypothetical protein